LKDVVRHAEAEYRSFLAAAEIVLKALDRPLTPKEIIDAAKERRLIRTAGLTPSQTMKSKLSTDIRLKGESSRFMRAGPGLFGLRGWKSRMPEYHAKRFKAALLDEDVLVLRRSALAHYVPGRGVHHNNVDVRALLAECIPMRRRLAEEDFSVVQLVSVFVLHYRDRVLTYKRSRRLPEARLHHTYSIAFGGHLNPDDSLPLLDLSAPDQALMLIIRELSEEIKLPKAQPPQIIYRGLIYDDSREVSRQHLGIVYDVYLKSEQFEIGERGFLMDARFETAEEIRERIDEFENWSEMLLRSRVHRIPEDGRRP
jgi:predicted NUDIX family phosphoesterase